MTILKANDFIGSYYLVSHLLLFTTKHSKEYPQKQRKNRFGV